MEVVLYSTAFENRDLSAKAVFNALSASDCCVSRPFVASASVVFAVPFNKSVIA